VLSELERFTPEGWEQEDDITLVAITRTRPGAAPVPLVDTSFSIQSAPGNERLASERVAEVVEPLGLAPERLEKLKTAVVEAAMNAIEHGNDSNPELTLDVSVRAEQNELAVRITDRGGGRPIAEAETPDLEAKLEGKQKPRGWGLFLIQAMVDDVRVFDDGSDHTIELVMRLEEGDDEHH
jgi:anti-sigma regulatory factor (Ser/Thr protein kinase)